MAWIKKNANTLIILALGLFVFLVFAYITRLTPLAGDDWSYAVAGRMHNPIDYAIFFYDIWSGRFFSEMWGFIVAPRKWLWNILNPLIFMGIFYAIMALIKPKKKVLTLGIIVIAVMFTVPQRLRIETYTWIMGTTYVIPLLLLLIYSILIKDILINKKKFTWWRLLIGIVLNIYICLCMENAAAIAILENVFILIYCYFHNRKHLAKFVVLLIVSIISFAILRLSPGSAYRLYRDNQGWLSMSVFEQISTNWMTFINYTYVTKNYLMFALSISLIFGCFNLFKKASPVKPLYIVLLAMNLICLFAAVSPILYELTHIDLLLLLFNTEESMSGLYFTSVFYPIYTALIIVELYQLFKKETFYEPLLYLMLAGSANIVMLFSPIFGERSSIYTVYFIIVLIAYLLNNLEISKELKISCIITFSLLIGVKMREFYYKYNEVARVQNIRIEQIKYYVENPDIEEAWIIKMPEGFIHSANVEEGDDFHMQYFKEYFGLNPDVHLIFYKEK